MHRSGGKKRKKDSKKKRKKEGKKERKKESKKEREKERKNENINDNVIEKIKRQRNWWWWRGHGKNKLNYLIRKGNWWGTENYSNYVKGGWRNKLDMNDHDFNVSCEVSIILIVSKDVL